MLKKILFTIFVALLLSSQCTAVSSEDAGLTYSAGVELKMLEVPGRDTKTGIEYSAALNMLGSECRDNATGIEVIVELFVDGSILLTTPACSATAKAGEVILDSSCINTCSLLSDISCAGTGMQVTCGNYDGDSCLEFGPPEACAEGTECFEGTGCKSTCNLNNVCDEGEDVLKCPQDCCNNDCTSKNSVAGQKVCKASCDGYNGCTIKPECAGFLSGEVICTDTKSVLNCCEGSGTCGAKEICVSGTGCENSCGNSALESWEECDVAQDAACPLACDFSNCECKPPVCGNNICESPLENVGNCAQDCCMDDCTAEVSGTSDNICHAQCYGIGTCGTGIDAALLIEIREKCDFKLIGITTCINESEFVNCCTGAVQQCTEDEVCLLNGCTELVLPNSAIGDVLAISKAEAVSSTVTEGQNFEIKVKLLNGDSISQVAEGTYNLLDAVTREILDTGNLPSVNVPAQGSAQMVISVGTNGLEAEKNYTLEISLTPKGGETITGNNKHSEVFTVIESATTAIAVSDFPFELAVCVGILVAVMLMTKGYDKHE